MKQLIFLVFLLSTTASAFSKEARSIAKMERENHRDIHAKTTLASPLLNDYDVHYLKLDLAMSNANTSIAGSSTTMATVANPSGMTQYAFELNDNLTIDSVVLNGMKLAATNVTTDVHTVTPSATIAFGNSFTATVFYHGTPKSGSGFFTHGLVHSVQSTGTNITFSLSDPYLAKDWWACKQSLNDKIDSADLWFTIADSLKAGSNGLLRKITTLGSGTSRYEWHTNYPIDYYLISVSVAPYVAHTQMLTFGGSSDMMPIQHFVYDTASFYPLYKAAIDSTPYMIDYLSTLYGRYPFWKEKYGHCIAPLGGGMEHQTMTTLGAFETPLIAHELGHQWWGDCVTYSSWRDVWLSEGFASYTEQLFVEHFRGKPAALAYRTGAFNRAMAGARGSVIVDDTTDVYRVFSSRLTYDKGAAVVHMLRYIAPSDSVFFAGLRNYQQLYAFKTANTAQFQQVMETAYGRSLDTFFKQWVYGEGYPIYTASWNQIGNKVFVKLEQSTSYPASVAAFNLPVPLRLKSGATDTLVVAYLNTASNIFEFTWQKPVDDLFIDPENNIVNSAGIVLQDPSLSVKNTPVNSAIIFPNPTENSWHISGLSGRNAFKLYDATGKVIWQETTSADTLTIDGKALLAGVYTLSARSDKGIFFSRTLLKI